MSVVDLIKKTVTEAVADIYKIVPPDVFVEHPDNEMFGDYSTNIALVLAKQLKQSPEEIAKKISYKLDDIGVIYKVGDASTKIFSSVEIAPPGFINFRLSADWLQGVLDDIQTDTNHYGVEKKAVGERIALEHSNVNPNKAAHIGHLRNACIGQFIERIYEFLGHKVDVQYYANDVGVQVATSLMGMHLIKDIKETSYAKFDHFAWDVYAKTESLMSQDPNLAKERNELMVRLENPASTENKEIRALANKILTEQLKTFQKLDIDYDIVVHEADILTLDFWKTAFEALKKNDNVYFATEGISQGCWLVLVSDKISKRDSEIDRQVEEDKIIVRSNGVPTYTGKDIAYHMWKFGLLGKDFFYEQMDAATQAIDLWVTTAASPHKPADITFSGVARVFDVIGGEQTYAMDVVKKTLKYLGYEKESQNMTHVNYGFVYLSPATAAKLGIATDDGKTRYGMSGRKGWGIKIDDFVDMVDEKLQVEHGAFPALKNVRNGAIKFEMLKYNTFQDLVFDLDAALNIKGFSGPYLQYTHARAHSVMEKAGYIYDPNLYQYDAKSVILDARELSIMRWLQRYPEVVPEAADKFAPNLMCTYLFELAQRFNLFYNDLSILGADTPQQRNFRLLLTKCVADVMKSGLFLLGISAPERI